MKKLFIIILGLSFLFISCKDKKEPEPSKTDSTKELSKINLKLEHTFNGQPLALNTKFVNAKGDTIQISELKYFLSNLILKNASTSTEDTFGYHLIDIKKGAIQEIDLSGFMPGTYDAIKLAVGVDKARNYSIESAKGDLDPAGATDGMIWTWSTGYKFLKFEGKYTLPTIPPVNGNFVIQTGGDLGYKEFSFDSKGTLEKGKTTELHLIVDVAELFYSPTLIDISKKLGHSGAGLIMDNMASSTEQGKKGWFELQHFKVE